MNTVNPIRMWANEPEGAAGVRRSVESIYTRDCKIITGWFQEEGTSQRQGATTVGAAERGLEQTREMQESLKIDG